MAKQCGEHTITGTIDNLCFYKMEGKFYVRQKSSLSRKRVQTDKAFAQTMHYARLLGRAAKVASAFYKTLPAEQKIKGLYKQLTGMVMRLLKEGKEEAVIIQELQHLFMPVVVNVAVEAKPVTSKPEQLLFADALLELVFLNPVHFVYSYEEDVELYNLKDYGFV